MSIPASGMSEAAAALDRAGTREVRRGALRSLLSHRSAVAGLGLLAVYLVGTVLGPGLRNVIISVGITSFPSFIRLLRASALSVRELPYVEAARALGVPAPVIMFRHVIPNSLAPVIVQATLWLGQAIITAAGLGFLGVGVQQPTPEWGGMLGASRDYIFSDSPLITFPGLCIFGAVLAFNLAGDGLRDVLDPRLKT